MCVSSCGGTNFLTLRFGSNVAGLRSNSELLSVSDDSLSDEEPLVKEVAMGMGMGADDAMFSSFLP